MVLTTGGATSLSKRPILPGTLRTVMALSLACAFGIFGFAAGMGLTGSKLVGAGVAVGLAALVAWFSWRYEIVPLDEGASTPALNVISALATVMALFHLVRLCVFIVNPAATGFAIGESRGIGQIWQHSCMSAYYVAARSVATTPNVYAKELYGIPQADPAQRKARTIDTFNMDDYEYPPTFLLLPRALALVVPEFLRFRMVWFALNGAVLIIGLLVVARFLGPVVGTRALLFSPLVLASDIPISTLQVGNLQAIVFSVAMIGMVLLAGRRYAAGGALLAFVTVSKMFPGLLIVYLLVQRKWRALAWTAGAAVALVAISLMDTGWAPYRAFLDHLPRLLGGEAFAGLRRPFPMAHNFSVPGMVLKPQLFGVTGVPFGAVRIAGWIYTVILLAATIFIARRRLTREQEPVAWLTILILASLRSPFLPMYALVPVLWLLTLLAATVPATIKTLCGVLLGWALLNIVAPRSMDPRLVAMITLMLQTATVVLIVLAIRSLTKLPGREPAPSGQTW